MALPERVSKKRLIGLALLAACCRVGVAAAQPRSTPVPPPPACSQAEDQVWQRTQDYLDACRVDPPLASRGRAQ